MVAATKESSDKIIIENIGPIAKLEISPKPGTITVFRGRNGAGKSTALQAINSLTHNSSQKLSSLDGTVGGSVEGFGATLKIARNGSNRHMGDVEVQSIEDKYNIADLVDPKIKDPQAADAKRIRALVSLAGIAANLDTFRNLFSSEQEFDAIVKPSSLKATDDVVQLADAIKRDVETAARNIEAKNESEWTRILNVRSQYSGATPVEQTQEQLKAQREEITLQKSSLLNQQQVYRTVSKEVDSILLQKAQQEERGLTPITDEHIKLSEIEAQESSWAKEIQRLETELKSAKDFIAKVQSDKREQQNKCQLALEQSNLMESWNRTINNLNRLPNPSEAEVSGLEKKVQELDLKLIKLSEYTTAQEKLKEANASETALAAQRDRASTLRKLAQKIPTVFAEAVRSLKSSVYVSSDFRLVADHKLRGHAYFSDLSHGERWTLALSLFIQAVEENKQPAILAIPQEAWEGLDGFNKKLIADIVAKTQLMVFTAESIQFTDKDLGESEQALGETEESIREREKLTATTV